MQNISGPLEERYVQEARQEIDNYIDEYMQTHGRFPDADYIVQRMIIAYQEASKRQSKNTENNYSLMLEGLYHEALPRNAINAVTMEPIEEGQNMVNFHGESELGRYYTQNTYHALKDKKNPFTRRNIKPRNLVFYKAKVKGGKRKTRRGKRQ